MDRIVRASHLPLSIVIVGVGDADFTVSRESRVSGEGGGKGLIRAGLELEKVATSMLEQARRGVQG